MAFKKRQSKKSFKRAYKEPDGKISLWTPDEDKKYVISGTIQLGDERYRVFIYLNDDPLYDNSPDYYGSIYVADEEKPAKSYRKPRREELEDDEDEDDDDEDDDEEEVPVRKKSKYVEKTTKVKSPPLKRDDVEDEPYLAY